jgi:diguanylate cyclase (GGDEF)-like protein/hemerythrin-like metal-binding protein
LGPWLTESSLVRCAVLDEAGRQVVATTLGMRELFGLSGALGPFDLEALIEEVDRPAALQALALGRATAVVGAVRADGAHFVAELRFEGRLVAFEDVTERRAAEERLRQLALYDPLTGLPNRTLLRDRVKQALLESRRDHTLVAVMVLDLDRFKGVNDEFGHQVGDQVLRVAARRIAQSAREADTVARVGGDEFVIAAHLAHREDAGLLAGRVVEAMAEPIPAGGRTHRIGISVGVAVSPDDGHRIDDLLLHADAAMYRAKHAGSHVAFCEPDKGQVLAAVPHAWDEDLNMGIASVDEEHRAVLAELHRLVAAVVSRSDPHLISKALEGLAASTQAHFESEERLMTQARYFALAAHAAEHRRLLDELQVLRRASAYGDETALALQHLDRRFVDHIETFDRQAARALAAHATAPG